MLKLLSLRLTTAALAALVLAGLISAAPASASSTPTGNIDAISWSGADLSLTGWALDPDHSAQSASVLVTIDGKNSGGWRTTGVTRTDVNLARGTSGVHGFHIVITLPNGSHEVCMSARPYGSTDPVAALGCGTVNIYVAPPATEGQYRSEIERIDPSHSVDWSFTKSFGTEAGWAVGNQVNISTTVSADWLRPIVIHEWSHVLQYRAFGADQYAMNAAIASFNAVAGTSGSYGIEHGADCIALSLGATKLGYGCPDSLRVFGSRVAHGLDMTRPMGGLSSATVSGSVFKTSGWAFDPANPRASGSIQVTDNGTAITDWTATKGASTQINAGYGIPGVHGFTTAVRLSSGKHFLCVVTKPITASTVTTLGCTSATTT